LSFSLISTCSTYAHKALAKKQEAQMDYISDVWNWTIIMSIIGAVTGITALWFSYLNSRKINSFIHKYEKTYHGE